MGSKLVSNVVRVVSAASASIFQSLLHFATAAFIFIIIFFKRSPDKTKEKIAEVYGN